MEGTVAVQNVLLPATRTEDREKGEREKRKGEKKIFLVRRRANDRRWLVTYIAACRGRLHMLAAQHCGEQNFPTFRALQFFSLVLFCL